MKAMTLKMVLLVTTLFAGQASFAELVKVDDIKATDYLFAINAAKPCGHSSDYPYGTKVYVDNSGSQPALRFMQTYSDGKYNIRIIADITTSPDNKSILSIVYRKETYKPVSQGTLTNPSTVYQWFPEILETCQQK
ncbi:MAG TPA: hypothetical protein VN132_03670 [Bdellovibrio sp.]|nr:hypothetical protein [Bdellovibrio sp.]